MYSLTTLNDYSNQIIQFEDERPAGYTTIPSNVANLPLSVVIGTEGETHLLPLPFTFGNAQSINMTYTVNVTPYTGATVSWNSYPGNIVLSNPATGIYRLTNIRTQSEWDAVRQPLVFLGADTSGNLVYRANLKPDANSQPISWTINAQLADTGEINTGFLPSFFYDQDVVKQFDSGLLVTDTNPSGTYSIFISKSDNAAGNLTSAGSGGTSTTSGQGNLTIAGTKSQVNSRLGNIIFTPASGYASNFTITYAVTNISGNVTNTATQLLKIGNINNGITDMYYPRTYTSNQSSLLFTGNVPFLSETITSGDTYSISLQLSSSIGFLAQTNDFVNRVGWDQNTLTYSYSGSLTQCNEKVTNLKIYPSKNQFSNVSVTYTQRRNGFFQLSTTFDLNGIYDNSPIVGEGTVNFIPNGWDTANYNIASYITYERLYLLDCDIFMIAGGGRTGQTVSATVSGLPGLTTYWGGGGGAGQYYAESKINLKALPLNATLQVGGVATATIWSGWKTLAPGANGQNGVVRFRTGHWRPTFWNANGIPPDYTQLISPVLQTYEQWQAFAAFVNGGGYWPGTYGTPSQELYTFNAYGPYGGNQGGSGFTGARGAFFRIPSANSPVYAGGGAGAGGHGQSPTVTAQGQGGSGVTSDITGSSEEYGRGSNGGDTTTIGAGSGNQPGYVGLRFTDPNPMPPIGNFGNIALISNSSGYFPGNGSSYLSGTLSSAINTSPFTVDFWIYPTDTNTSDRCIFDIRSTGGTATDGFAIRYASSNQMMFIYSASLSSIQWNRTNNVWQHIAIVRANGVVRIFVNGLQVGSTTLGASNTYSNLTWRLGQFKDSNTNATGLLGYVDEFRVSNAARYAGDFQPANYPFDVDSNTMLLLHFNGSNDSQSFVNSVTNGLVGLSGNVRVSTAQYKF
jgi:hypothetical protein